MCTRLPFDTAQRLIESWRLPLGSMRTDLSVEEAGAVVDPPKCREDEPGHWYEEKGRKANSPKSKEFHGAMAAQPGGGWARILAERLMAAGQTRG